MAKPVPLARVLKILETLAPLRYAADWDNVGLLVEPPPWPREVKRIALTIDLTEPVLEEAASGGADLVVAYHPPIFGGVKALTGEVSLQRVLMRVIREGIAVYSPHTALDAAPGGLNDWLVEGLGEVTEVEPIEAQLEDGVGLGRVARLADPEPLDALVERTKGHLGLRHVRLARAPGHATGRVIERVAVCPGAGGSVFANLRKPVDLLLTGEMRHHDVLARVAAGTSVILTDHTNTERGYLPRLKRLLQADLGAAVDVVVATADRDPLKVV